MLALEMQPVRQLKHPKKWIIRKDNQRA